MRFRTLELVSLALLLTVPVAAQFEPGGGSPLCAAGSIYVEPGTLGALRNSIVSDLRANGPFPITDEPADWIPRLIVTPSFDTSTTPPRILMQAELHDGDLVIFSHRTQSFSDLRGAGKEVVRALGEAFRTRCPNGHVQRARGPEDFEPVEEAEPLIANLTPEAQELLDQAVAHHEAGRFHDAIEVWKRYLKLMPDDSFGYANIAITYLQIEDYRAAARALERSVKLNASNDIALYNLAYSYYKLSWRLRALRALEATLQVNPWHEKALGLLAQMRREGI